MADPSPSWRRFLESFEADRNTDRRYADNLNLAALAELRPAERERAERLMIERLRADPSDDRVPEGLARLGSLAAIEPLRQNLAAATGATRVRIAAALSALDPAYDGTEVCIEALQSGNFVARGGAVRLLGDGSPAQVREPLLAALGDADFGVRVAAFEALLRAYELKAIEEPPHSPLRAVGCRLLSRLSSVHTAAAAEMRALIGKLERGRTPEALGLTELPTAAAPDVQRILDSLFASRPKPPWDEDLALALGRLEGGARRYIECALLSELENGDPRIPRALAGMGSEAAVAPLREVVASVEVVSDSFWETDTARQGRIRARVEAARALEILAGDGTGRQALEAMRDGEHGEAARAALAEITDPA